VRLWRNWQTHQLEGLALAIAWWFESTQPHQTSVLGVLLYSICEKASGLAPNPGKIGPCRGPRILPPTNASAVRPELQSQRLAVN
jgi:hypothetical protein